MADKKAKEPKEVKEQKQAPEGKETKEPAEKAKKGQEAAKTDKPAADGAAATTDPAAATAGVVSAVPMGPPGVTNDDNVFAVCHILATSNDTFIHVTDLTGRETLVRVTGGMKVKADRDESSPYAAMLAAVDVVNKLKELKINAVHIRLRGKGGHNSKAIGGGAQPALRTLARYGLKMGRIEDVTPIPTDSTRRKCGRKGRRL